MSLKFLSKKSFHTKTIHNVERTWQAEQNAEAEKKKVEEVRKRLEQDRHNEELLRLQAEASGLSTSTKARIEWLYTDPVSEANRLNQDCCSADSMPGAAEARALTAREKVIEEVRDAMASFAQSGKDSDGIRFQLSGLTAPAAGVSPCPSPLRKSTKSLDSARASAAEPGHSVQPVSSGAGTVSSAATNC